MIVCKKIKWRREQVKKDKSDLNKETKNVIVKDKWSFKKKKAE